MPRHATADSASFKGVWGYCAIVGTRELMWSGYRIPDPAGLPELDDYVASLQQGLSLTSAASNRIFTAGAVSWLANELVEVTYRAVNEGEDEIGRDAGEQHADLLAAALARIAGQRFFLVLLERNRAKQPISAQVEALGHVASPEDARDYILHHPRILTLEAEGMRRLQAGQPAAPAEAQAALFTCERLHGPVN